MADAINLLDQDAAVQRYAWFAPRTAGDWLGPTASLLQADTAELTQLGKIYTSEQAELPLLKALAGDPLQSWTSMCNGCFLPHQPPDVARSRRQLCIDCGFYDSVDGDSSMVDAIVNS